jgi:hypothetical protein
MLFSVHFCCHGDVFTQRLPRNGSLFCSDLFNRHVAKYLMNIPLRPDWLLEAGAAAVHD